MQTVTEKPGFVIGGFIITPAYYDAASHVIEDITNVAVPVLQGILVLTI